MSIPEFYAEPAEPVRKPVEPYGFIGLVLTTVLICLLGLLIMAILLGAMAFGWIFTSGTGPLLAAMNDVSGLDIYKIKEASWVAQMTFYVVLAASFIGFGLAVLAFARLRGGAQWRDPIAWHRPAGWPARRHLWILAVAALAYMLAAGFGIKLIYPSFKTWFFVPDGLAGLALSLLTVVLLAPWAEELFFRGWLFTSLRRSFGAWTGIALVTLIFALAHLDPTRLYPLLIFLPGLMLTLLREHNESTKASFYGHAAYNFMAWFVLLVVGNS